MNGVPVRDCLDEEALLDTFLVAERLQEFKFATPEVADGMSYSGFETEKVWCRRFLLNLGLALGRHATDLSYAWSYKTCTTTLRARFVHRQPREQVLSNVTDEVRSPVCDSPPARLTEEVKMGILELLSDVRLLTVNGFGVRAWGDDIVNLVANADVPKILVFAAPRSGWCHRYESCTTVPMVQTFGDCLRVLLNTSIVCHDIAIHGSIMEYRVTFRRSA